MNRRGKTFAVKFAKTVLMINTRAAVIILVIAFIAACNNKPAGNETTSEKKYISKNTDSFNLAFDQVLSNYDGLRNAFIDWDTASANKYASVLQNALISVPYSELHDEAEGTRATSIAQNAADEIQVLLTEDSINNKRRLFYTVSESIYNLIKTTGYDKQVIYHKKCPMAFNGDKEGWWFSETQKIDNPYFGKKHPKYKNAMLECGTVEDSINNMQ